MQSYSAVAVTFLHTENTRGLQAHMVEADLIGEMPVEDLEDWAVSSSLTPRGLVVETINSPERAKAPGAAPAVEPPAVAANDSVASRRPSSQGIPSSRGGSRKSIYRSIFEALIGPTRGKADDGRDVLGASKCASVLSIFDAADPPPLVGLQWAALGKTADNKPPEGQSLKSMRLSSALRDGKTSFTTEEANELGTDGTRWARAAEPPANGRALAGAQALAQQLEAGRLTYTQAELTALIGPKALDMDVYVEAGGGGGACFVPVPSGLSQLSERSFIKVDSGEYYRPVSELQELQTLIGTEWLCYDDFKKLIELKLQRVVKQRARKVSLASQSRKEYH